MLLLAKWASLLNTNKVPFQAFIFLIVHLVLFGCLNNLFKNRVRESALHLNEHCLIHFITDNHARHSLLLCLITHETP